MKIGRLLPYRSVYIIGQEKIWHYKVQFGKIISSRHLTVQDFLLFQPTFSFSFKDILKFFFQKERKSEFLIDTLAQEITLEKLPKGLKFFDRFSFIYHRLKKIFGTDAWIGVKWFSRSNPAYCVAYHLEKTPNLLQKKIQNAPDIPQCGALIAEIKRLKIFSQGEGVIFAPCTEEKIVREIYIKNHFPLFVRFVPLTNLNWPQEIQRVKRYIHRYFQTEERLLSLGWWGAHPPLEEFTVISSASFQEELLQSYLKYWGPVLSFFPHLRTSFFTKAHALKSSKILLFSINIFLILFLLQDTVQIYEIQEELFKTQQKIQYTTQVLAQTKNKLNKIFPTEHLQSKSESILRAYHLFEPLKRLPFKEFKEIASLNTLPYKMREVFWGRGKVEIHPFEYTLKFTASSFAEPHFPQEFIVGIMGRGGDSLEHIESTICSHFQKSRLKILKIETDFSKEESLEKTALIHLKGEERS